MRIPYKRPNRGIALIVTLTIITLLVTVSLELNRQVRSAVTDSAAFRDRVTLRHMLNSGVNLAEAILVRDKQDSEADSIQEDWADPEILQQHLAQLEFEQGEISLDISDEMARIQVNALVNFPKGREFNENQHKLWQRFINLLLTRQEEADESFFSESIEPSEIIDPVKDWLDSGDNDAITGLNGAEEDYYRDLDPPYGCRNGPVRRLEELLRIKGITGELFHSSDAAGEGIGRYMTVHGLQEAANGFTYPGKININTAEIPVIAGLLPAGMEFLAPEIAAYRAEKQEGEYVFELSGSDWYQQVPGCRDVEINPELITTQSDIFRIECQGKLNDMKMTARVVVERHKEKESGKWTCRVLSQNYE